MEPNQWDSYMDDSREPHLASIAESNQVERGSFVFRVKEDDKYVVKYTGRLDELGEAYAIYGLTMSFIVQGMEVQFVFNPQDLDEKPAWLPPHRSL